MKVIILAGGGGSRLFPLSRKSFPKQFLRLEDERSLLAHTIARYLPLVSARDIVFVTNERYLYHMQSELAECHAEEAHIVLEPVARNTAPAIALAAKYCESELGCAADEVLLVAAADHIIRPQAQFEQCVRRAIVAAQDGAFVTFGIEPTKPETGYGYIEADVQEEKDAYPVQAFKEKPDRETAERYLAAGNYFWNSGMFAFTLGSIMGELAALQPKIFHLLQQSYDGVRAKFSKMPEISIDYAVAEKSKHVRMVPLSCYWNDIGSWDAMYDILPKDAEGNALKGDCLTLDCHDTLIMGRDRLIAGIGLDDLLLVETDDVIVVARRGESQKVKNVVEGLKRRGRREAVEHTTLYHAWGTTQILGKGSHYLMKKVHVLPGKSLMRQMHFHRSEHWIILAGTAEVLRGEERVMVHENESVFIPQTTVHQLKNPGRIPLELIEVQNGAYIGEDDIVRYED